jgi:integrase
MGYVSGNPARRLPLPKLEQHVPVTLTEEQVQQLLAAAEEPWHRCLVVLLLATGQRRSEVVQIDLQDVDAENRQSLQPGLPHVLCSPRRRRRGGAGAGDPGRGVVALTGAAAQAGMLFLLLTGGEVFPRPDFLGIYRPLTDVGLHLAIYSSGTLITPPLARALRERPRSMTGITL